MELSAELREVALEAQALAGETTVNGHANGDSEIQVEPLTGGADPVASGSTLPALTETLSSVDPISLHDPTSTTHPTPTAVANATTTWQAHNLDIDLISLKLSKHKYLTPSDFLADIAKIEENAEK